MKQPDFRRDGAGFENQREVIKLLDFPEGNIAVIQRVGIAGNPATGVGFGQGEGGFFRVGRYDGCEDLVGIAILGDPVAGHGVSFLPDLSLDRGPGFAGPARPSLFRGRGIGRCRGIDRRLTQCVGRWCRSTRYRDAGGDKEVRKRNPMSRSPEGKGGARKFDCLFARRTGADRRRPFGMHRCHSR